MKNGHRLMPFLAALGFLALAPAVYAAPGTATVTWTNPTQYVDGSSLPASALTGYDFTCAFTPTGSSTALPCTGFAPVTVTGGARSSVAASFTYPGQGGVACFQVLARVAGAVSDPSVAACKTFDAIKPNPPTGVTVTVTVAMTIKGLPAGTQLLVQDVKVEKSPH